MCISLLGFKATKIDNDFVEFVSNFQPVKSDDTITMPLSIQPFLTKQPIKTKRLLGGIIASFLLPSAL